MNLQITVPVSLSRGFADRHPWVELHEVPEPHAGRGEVRVRVTAVGLNPVDWMLMSMPDLAHGFGIALPSGFGTDLAGTAGNSGAQQRCLMPADYLRSVGFETVRPHPLYPRLRMEMKSTVSWRYDVEYALERIFAANAGLAPAR